MKKTLLSFLVFLSIISIAAAQTPGVLWKKLIDPKTYNTRGQVIYGIDKIPGGGFVMVGFDTSFAFDKTKTLDKEAGEYQVIIKADTAGKVIWGTRGGAYSNSAYTSVVATSGGEFVTTGFQSIYNYTASLYENKISVVKFSANGAGVWGKEFGGLRTSMAQGITKTNDGGYAIAGYTNCNDTTVTDNHGTNTYDFWILKLNATGTLQWKRCFGGSGDDKAYDIKQTTDGGYIVVGKNNSTNGNVTQSRGSEDAWIIKLDNVGNLVWQKSLGGSNLDVFKSVIQTPDGGYIAVGNTFSNDLDVSGNHGNWDVWVVKLDATGNVVWKKCMGGSNMETGANIISSEDHAYLITGHTESNNGDVTGANGFADAWLIKIDDAGNIIWNKPAGSSTLDEYGFGAAAVSENQVYLTSTGTSLSGGDPSDGFLSKLGNTSTIKGTVYLDNNRNGVKDATEPFTNNVVVQTVKSGYVRSTIPSNGSFRMDVDTGQYLTSATFYNPYYTVVPSVITSNFTSYFATDSISFAMQPMAGKRDVSVNLAAITPARPGFNAQYKLFYKNDGTDTIATGTVQFVKSNKLTVLSTSPAYSSINGDTLRWNYSNLKPQDTANILINLKVAAPPTVNFGDRLNFVASILPVASDITPANDTARLIQLVGGSYDPNDKKEAHGGVLTQQQVAGSEWLNYTIRFQNTGTDTAFTVIVRDTLSSKVDWNSLQMTSASHAYQLAIKEGNKLTWTFDNIKLVDSIRNEPASHGYISFKIKANSNLSAGDTVRNTASIYFDYNLPVQTNAENTVVESVVLPVKVLSFTARRDGANNLVEWSTSNEINVDQFEVQASTDGRNFSTLGKVHAAGNSKYKLAHNLPAKATNYYRLKIIDKDGKFEYTVVRKINNTGNVQLLLYPNPATDKLLVQFDTDKKATPVVEIIDVNGKVISSVTLRVDAGVSTKTIDISGLASGNYFFKVIFSSEESMLYKFQKL
jgi:fimbrial isopeptide formation D2 family protein